MNALFEFLPLILFLGAYIYKDIYFALIVLMIAMPIGFVVKYFRTKTFDKMYFWSTIFLLVAGALTFYFRNPEFLYWKPTVFYWVAAVALLAGQFVGDRNLVQRFFGALDEVNLEKVSSSEWKLVNLVCAGFAAAMGFLNIYVARNFEEATWVKFKVFGLMGIQFVFLFCLVLWVVYRAQDDQLADVQEGSD